MQTVSAHYNSPLAPKTIMPQPSLHKNQLTSVKLAFEQKFASDLENAVSDFK